MGFQESNSRPAALAAAPGADIDAGVARTKRDARARGGVDIAGQVFGRLTALRPSDRTSYWWYRCSCGNERELLKGNVKAGHSKSCGCLLSQRYKPGQAGAVTEDERRRLDFTGERFGALTAIRYVSTGKRGARWLFRCDCGIEMELTAKDVRYGHRKSCGCQRYRAWASPAHQTPEIPETPKVANGFPVRGMSIEQFAEAAEWYGIDGSAAGLIAFACEMQRAISRACDVPAPLRAGAN